MEGVSIDTRSGCEHRLFIALKGASADGHDFLREAVQKGAAALLVSSGHKREATDLAGALPVFDVPDTLRALQALAAAYRALVNPRVIAITGSTGKTGTKEYLAAIVARRYRVMATPGNLNNHIGLPLTILGMEGSEDICVTEMGANHKREIKALADIAKPEIGIVTNIGPAHLEFFGSLKGVAAAKAELLDALPGEGIAVLPADDEFVDFLKGRAKARTLTFGFAAQADRRITSLEKRDSGGYRFRVGDTPIEVPRYGKHHVLNAAAAAVVGSELGIPPDEIAAAVLEAKVNQGRGVLFDIDGIIFFDDSYNSNPASLRASVDAFIELPAKGRRWLVLGDMLELGDSSADLHREAGVFCGRAKVDGILTIGIEAVELNRAASGERRSPEHITHFIDVDALARHLNELVAPGDAVLVKGSRGMHMERVLDAVEKLRGAARRRVD
ncbi:MAG: UDP-N-acetylmuramoyl-tripeptide--D-alanyl-D-alanine ligase [Candidatus Krumholzibacteria bacterium]|nr:UDP-N-acetylmuramoyl-tripeptide--D-alanyl-D-alanine ligase [Candidatus Krumholzibacteria bacterium]